MPVSYSTAEKKKGVEKRFSLSLKKNNAVLLNTDSDVHLTSVTKKWDSFFIHPEVEVNPNQVKKQGQESLDEHLYGESKENKSLKRPCKSVYSDTLNAAKKLKPIDSSINKSQLKDSENELILTLGPPNTLHSILRPSAMLNGHHQPDLGAFGESTSTNNHNSVNQKKAPIATLANLGNTCFLNSVLYTLRFAPRFLHNLHHLVTDLALVDQKLGSIRLKSSSLGRGAAGLAASGTRSWSSKDLLSLGQSDNSQCKSKIQIATERLHETYSRLYTAESRCLSSSASDAAPEPYAADAFLSALRDVNSTFEGNRQQDAHELLMCVLDSIRETCRDLRKRSVRLQQHELSESNHSLSQQSSVDSDSAANLICTKPSLVNLRKSWKKRKEAKHAKSESPGKEQIKSPPSIPEDEVDCSDKPGWDFVASDFEGTTVSRTTCFECEMVTERKQAMCDIGVPILEESDPQEDTDEPFAAACLTSECLRDQNKYWCDRCLRYNEARRSVAYETLPRLLVLQLKRFSGGMEKITRHAPTPRHLTCFCEACAHCSPNAKKHSYTLWAVIVHLGQTLSGGHYVAYARRAGVSCDRTSERDTCQRDGVERGPERSGFMRSLFTRGRVIEAGCGARTCCAVPTQSEDDVWFMCDDDLVTPVSQEDFNDLLSAEPKIRTAATPYLLFYVKTDIA